MPSSSPSAIHAQEYYEGSISWGKKYAGKEGLKLLEGGPFVMAVQGAHRTGYTFRAAFAAFKIVKSP